MKLEVGHSERGREEGTHEGAWTSTCWPGTKCAAEISVPASERASEGGAVSHRCREPARERANDNAPAGTSASSVTSNSATRIFGSTPALRNWPMRAPFVFLALRGEVPTMTVWRAGVLRVAG